MKSYETRGEAIRDLRKKSGMSQEELARRIGTTKQAIYKYENGIVTNIPSDKIEAMSKIFGVSPAVIMGWETDYSVHDRLIEQYSEKLLALDDAQRTAVMTMIDELLKRRD